MRCPSTKTIFAISSSRLSEIQSLLTRLRAHGRDVYLASGGSSHSIGKANMHRPPGVRLLQNKSKSATSQPWHFFSRNRALVVADPSEYPGTYVMTEAKKVGFYFIFSVSRLGCTLHDHSERTCLLILAEFGHRGGRLGRYRD